MAAEDPPPEHAPANASASIATIRAVLTRITITRRMGVVAERFAPLVRDQRAALLGVLAGVSGGDWARPTACAPWTLKDVVSHLVQGELLFGGLYRSEIVDIASDTEAGVELWRRVDGETVRYSLWHHGLATQRVIDSRSDESWRRVVDHSSIAGPLELRHALRIHFYELAIHGHDVTQALDAPNIWEERTGTLVEYCLRVAPSAIARSGAALKGVVEIRVPEAGVRTLEGSSGTSWILSSGPASVPTAVWEADAETLVLATAGRVTPADALERSNVAGDAGFLGAFLEAWRVTA